MLIMALESVLANFKGISHATSLVKSVCCGSEETALDQYMRISIFSWNFCFKSCHFTKVMIES